MSPRGSLRLPLALLLLLAAPGCHTLLPFASGDAAWRADGARDGSGPLPELLSGDHLLTQGEGGAVDARLEARSPDAARAEAGSDATAPVWVSKQVGTDALLGLWQPPGHGQVLVLGDACKAFWLDPLTGVSTSVSLGAGCTAAYSLYAAAGASASDYFVVGHNNGKVLRVTAGSLQPDEWTTPDYSRGLVRSWSGALIAVGHDGSTPTGWAAQRGDDDKWHPWDKLAYVADLLGVASSGSTVLMVGINGTILRLPATGAGQPLSESSGTTNDLRHVWSAADGSWAVAVGEGPTLLQHNSALGTWTPRTLASLPAGLLRLHGVWAASPSRVFVVGSGASSSKQPCDELSSDAKGWLLELDLTATPPTVNDTQPATSALCTVTGASWNGKTYVIAVGESGAVLRRAPF